MTDSKKNRSADLAEDHLSGVTGGKTGMLLHPMGIRRCAANPDHVYVDIHDACPLCGCKEFTRA